MVKAAEQGDGRFSSINRACLFNRSGADDRRRPANAMTDGER